LLLRNVLGRIERDLPRYQLISRMASALGRDLLDALFKLEGMASGRRSTYPITSPTTGTFWRDIKLACRSGTVADKMK
jgi:hypothetical protein